MRADDLRADDLRAVDFLADDLRADDFRPEDLRADDFRPEDFFAAVLRPPFLPPLRLEAFDVFLPRPEPDFLPPPVDLFTVAHARASASFFETPRSS